MDTPKDIVLVSVKQKYNNEIEISDGQVIWLDTSFKPMHHVSICGIVEALPRMLSPNHYAHGQHHGPTGGRQGIFSLPDR